MRTGIQKMRLQAVITRDVKAIRVKSSGYHSWTEAEILAFEMRHPIGSRAWLAWRCCCTWASRVGTWRDSGLSMCAKMLRA
jgi:hypothetical protein